MFVIIYITRFQYLSSYRKNSREHYFFFLIEIMISPFKYHPDDLITAYTVNHVSALIRAKINKVSF